MLTFQDVKTQILSTLFARKKEIYSEEGINCFMWLSRNQLICNQHPGMLPSGGQQCSLYKACNDSELPSVGWRETLVLRFLPSQASQDHFPALCPSFGFIFQPLDGGCALGYQKLSMIVLNKRPHQWPNSSIKDVSFISIPANGAHPKQHSSPSLAYV